MIQEISMALTSLKTAKEILKSNSSDKIKISELHNIIADLSDRHHSIQTAYTELQQENINLNKKISQLLQEKNKRDCYKRIKLPSGFFIYRYQECGNCKETTHDICVNCFDSKGQTFTLQPMDIKAQVYHCVGCNKNIPYLPERDSGSGFVKFDNTMY